MLPEPQNAPAKFSELSVCFPIPLHIASDLREPKIPIRLRLDKVAGTPVPETAVNKNGDSLAHEDQVGGAAKRGHWSNSDAVPEPELVGSTSDG